MNTDFAFALFLLIHFLFVLVFFILIKLNLLKISMQLFPLILFLPLFGPALGLTAEYTLRKNLTGSREIQLDKFFLSENDYRGINLTEDPSEKIVVPLEEAVLINDPETRKKLMIDILMQDPGQYIDLLQTVREDKDMEVTHYASTAIMEIQREYELRIKKLLYDSEKDPKDMSKLDDCIKALGSYIKSGLIEENLLYMQRTNYNELLKRRIQTGIIEKDLYYEIIDNCIELGDYNDAKKHLDIAIKTWFTDESFRLLKIKFYDSTQNGAMIAETLEEIKRDKVYLSPEASEKIKFWNRKI